MPDPSSTTDDRYTRAHAEWEIQRVNAASALIAVRLDGTSVAEMLLIGGTWVVGNFRPTQRENVRFWISDAGVVVPDAAVQARTMADSPQRKVYAEIVKAEPAPTCPASFTVFDGEEAATEGLTASSSWYCGECDHSTSLAASPEGLVVIEHDRKGRPVDGI